MTTDRNIPSDERVNVYSAKVNGEPWWFEELSHVQRTRIRALLSLLQTDIDFLRNSNEKMKLVLKSLDDLGGLGEEKHRWIKDALKDPIP